MADATPTERELKIPVGALEPVRERLRAVGAEPASPSGREVNILFDGDDHHLAAAGEVLRLRRYGDRAVLTFKGPAAYEGAVKSREELETTLTDAEVAAAILRRLGFAPRLRYEKDRELWRLDEVEVALDHTPMGEFVELEGPGAGPARAARKLGLDVERAVRGSYVDLWRAYREAHPELDLPEDMVFSS